MITGEAGLTVSIGYQGSIHLLHLRCIQGFCTHHDSKENGTVYVTLFAPQAC